MTTRRRNRLLPLAGLIAVGATAAAIGYHRHDASSQTSTSFTDVMRTERAGTVGDAVPSTVWPVDGQAAFVESGDARIHAGPNQRPAAIASVAKVMTAYLVLRDHPLRPDQTGPTLVLTDADAADTDRRRGRDESVVPVVAGEELSELQALQALLLPSANNIAAVLARWDAGSVKRFVGRMNETARSLGMMRTRYTDPSGYDDATVLTAADRSASWSRQCACRCSPASSRRRARHFPSPARSTTPTRCSGTPVSSASRPAPTGPQAVASHSVRSAGLPGTRTTVTGVVLGQPGGDPIAAGLAAADAMVDRITRE